MSHEISHEMERREWFHIRFMTGFPSVLTGVVAATEDLDIP